MSDPITRLNAALEGRYRIESELGEGGMANVYLADDLKHERKVALKVLKPELAAVVGAERFLAEIKTTANLQHPHILPLFDSGEADKFLFYVMPYVEGETLRDRLDREHQLPVDDAVRIASDVAEALEYAHGHGVIHRDIKPANILIQAGRPLIADFGIALAVSASAGHRLTETGLSLGTPHYMSPEQATGDQHVGPATDIYALGCVLYEMLVGEPPFTGSTPQAILGKIIAGSPETVSAQRKSVPPNVDAAIAKALERLPADRFSAAGSFARILGEPGFRYGVVAGKGGVEKVDHRVRATAFLPWSLLAVSIALGSWAWLRAPANYESAAPGRVQIELPGIRDMAAAGESMSMSADGRLVVYAASYQATQRLMLRRVRSLVVDPVRGTEGATTPFLSPDGGWIGFRRGTQLFTVPSSGGVATPVRGTEGVSTVGRPAWTPDGRIVFTNAAGGLAITREDGSAPDTLTRPQPAERHVSPWVLPDGRSVIYSALGVDLSRSTIDVVAINDLTTRTLLDGGVNTPQYAQGYLVHANTAGSLLAAPFDPGEANVLGPSIEFGDVATMTRFGVAQFAVGWDLLLYNDESSEKLIELDEQGLREELGAEPGSTYHHPRYSPNGLRVVLDRRRGGTRDVWVYDRTARTFSKITSLGDAHDPTWLPGGQDVSFLRVGAPDSSLMITAATGTGEVRPVPISGDFSSGELRHPGVWLSDGSAYIGGVERAGRQSDLWLIPADGTRPTQLTDSDAREVAPALSRDDQLLAYQGDRTGRAEIYVRTLGGDQLLLVSSRGGTSPAWGPEGELYFLELGTSEVSMVRATLAMDPTLRVVSTTTVTSDVDFQLASNHRNYDIHPTEPRYIVSERSHDGTVAVFNWPGVIERSQAGGGINPRGN